MTVPDERQVGAADGNVVLDLFVLHQRIGELMELALEGTGIRPAEYAVYSQLGIEAMTPRQLGNRLGVAPSTLTGHLAVIQRRAHARRVAHPADGRSYRLELTTSGRRSLESGRVGFRTMLSRFEAALPAEIDRIRSMLVTVEQAAVGTVRALRETTPG